MLPTSISFRCSVCSADLLIARIAAARGHRVADADDRFLRNARLVPANGGEDRRADEGEHQAGDVGARAVRLDAVQHRDGGAERRDLRQRQIDEDHAALDHVDAQIGVNAGQNQARDKGGEKKRESVHRWSLFELGERVDQQIDIVIEQLEVVGDFLIAAHRWHQDDHLAAHV